jgi:hypothetical protein
MRRSIPAALAAVAVAILAVPTPAGAAAAVFVEINPSTVRAGDEVGLRASCTDNLNPAVVAAEPWGSIQVKPSFGFLTATTRVSRTTTAGDYRVTLRCPDKGSATAVLHVVARVEPAQGPATGGGGTAPGRQAPLMIGGGAGAIAVGIGLAVYAARRRRLG